MPQFLMRATDKEHNLRQKPERKEQENTKIFSSFHTIHCFRNKGRGYEVSQGAVGEGKDIL